MAAKVVENFNHQKLKAIIKERGLRLDWVASRLGVSKNTLEDVLCSRRQPSLPLAKFMALFFETDESELIGEGSTSYKLNNP